MEPRVLNACNEIVGRVSDPQALGFRGAFGAQASEAYAAGDLEIANALRLFEAVFSMFLRADPHQPFGPLATFTDGTRTLMPEDLTDDQLGMLEAALERAEKPAFVARIADVLWLRRGKPAFARRAIQAYLASTDVPNADSWVPQRDALRRATQLACSLGRDAAERHLVRDKLVARFNESMTTCVSPGMGYWPAALAEILIENELLDDWLWLGDACKQIGRLFLVTPGCDEPRKYYELASECYKLAKRADQVEAMRLAIGEHWKAEATAIRDAGGDALLVSHRLQSAINAFRKTTSGQEEAKRLAVDLKEAQRTAMGELKVLSTSVDITPLVEEAQRRMTGKVGQDAILTFLRLHRPVTYGSAREAAEKTLKEHPLQSIVTSAVLTPEGNVAAVLSGETEDLSGRLEAGMVQQYNLCQSLAGAVLLEEARSIIHSGPDTSWQSAILDLIAEHPLVPITRSEIYARALVSGFAGDGLVFLHIMIPQVEYLVREALHGKGLRTTSIDHIGVQEERDLNVLLRDSAAEPILGKDLIWELRSLLTEKCGPNLRNRLCHGLLQDTDFSPAHATFFLWLTLFLMIVTIGWAGSENVEGSQTE